MTAMLEQLWQSIGQLLLRGGWVMWPLLGLSVIALTLIFERCWFWLANNHPARLGRVRHIARLMRQNKFSEARAVADRDRSIYGRLAMQLLDEDAGQAVVTEAIETQRPRMERFMTSLGTIITAAPLLGILGTVTGIIQSFAILSDQAITDPSLIGSGIAEALLTTVVGLIIALVVLFPYNAFRAQTDRSLGRMQMLIAAARQRHDEPQRDQA
jgi:biopolymer transport protein ExbB